MKKLFKSFSFFFLSIMFLEIIYKLFVFKSLFNINLLYTSLFSTIYALFLTILNLFLPKKIKFSTILFSMFIITVIFISEAIFSILLNTTFSFYSLSLSSQAIEFKSIAITTIKNNIFMVLLFLVPIILYIFIHKKIDDNVSLDKLYIYSILYIFVYFLSLVIISFNSMDTYSAYNLYYNTHAPTIAVNKLGLLTEFRLDLTRYIFGFNPSFDSDNNTFIKEKKTRYNEQSLNFEFGSDNNILDMNKYFKSRNLTNQNEYTGKFKNKNLIYILAEGFNTIAIDEKLTPTLYKLTNSGLQFENYYSPVFMSTTGGEFQYMLSLIPTQQSLNKWKEGNIYLPYTIGNAFDKDKYLVNAYHNWSYNYYNRDITMPEMGFDNYTACKNGLESKMNCKSWPTSDVDMINSTIDDYINAKHFVSYYITVSGHAEYNFSGNFIAKKNYDLVKDLDYPDEIKAYRATQIELDRALEVLINKLKESKKLNNTVIVISGDHYPYTLSTDIINTVSSYKRDLTFEVNNSKLIIYNPKLEDKKIDKLASSVDVLPTILNMFGISYDSRLLMGSDIFSKHDSLVIFSDYSWISEKGRYNATKAKFIPNNKSENIPSDYVANINNEVQRRVKISTNIFETNYYKVLNDNQNVCLYKDRLNK